MSKTGAQSNFCVETLSHSKYGSYFRAIQENDVDTVSGVLRNASPTQCQLLTNGLFCAEEENLEPKHVTRRMTRPLIVAVMMGSVEVMKLLLEKGAKIFQENCFKENMVHSLVASNSLELISEQRSICTYKSVMQHVDTQDLVVLLKHENSDGLRPLEMAANLGCLNLYEVIHHTPGVYVTKVKEEGIIRQEWVDITEYETYESGSRIFKSPLFLLSYLDETDAFEMKHGNIAKSLLIMQWLALKSKAFVPTAYGFGFYLVFHILCLAISFTGESGDSVQKATDNSSAPSCSHQPLYVNTGENFMIVFLTYLALLGLFNVFSITSFLHQNHKYNLGQRKQKLNRKKHLNGFLFSLLFPIQVSNWTAFAVALFKYFKISHTEAVTDILTSICYIYSIPTLLYIIEIFSLLEFVAITIVKMISILVQFISVYTILFLPFVHTLFVLLHTKDGCANPDFSPSTLDHFYNSFLLLLNMVDMRQFRHTLQNENYYLLLFVHILYICLFSILLINLLIALFSISVANIMQHKEIMILNERLQLIGLLERMQDSVLVPRFVGVWLKNRLMFHKDGRVYLIITSTTTEKGTWRDISGGIQ